MNAYDNHVHCSSTNSLSFQRSCDFDISQLRTILQNGSFWQNFVNVYTNGDGHCLLYSIIESMKSQLDIDINYSDLCNRIRKETIDNINYYKDLILINSDIEIQRLLCVYVDGKNFDTRFGDLIPLILSNVLSVGIIIITKNSYDPLVTFPRTNSNGYVYVYKIRDHYEGVKMVFHIDPPIGIQHTTSGETTNHRATQAEPCSNSGDSLRESVTCTSSTTRNSCDGTHSSFINPKILAWNIYGLVEYKLEANESLASSLYSTRP